MRAIGLLLSDDGRAGLRRVAAFGAMEWRVKVADRRMATSIALALFGARDEAGEAVQAHRIVALGLYR